MLLLHVEKVEGCVTVLLPAPAAKGQPQDVEAPPAPPYTTSPPAVPTLPAAPARASPLPVAVANSQRPPAAHPQIDMST